MSSTAGMLGKIGKSATSNMNTLQQIGKDVGVNLQGMGKDVGIDLQGMGKNNSEPNKILESLNQNQIPNIPIIQQLQQTPAINPKTNTNLIDQLLSKLSQVEKGE